MLLSADTVGQWQAAIKIFASQERNYFAALCAQQCTDFTPL